jgi:Flp pilus assembly protein TadD
VTDNQAAEVRDDARASRTGVDRLLMVGVAVAGVAVLVVAILIGWSVFGPKQAPRTEAERLMQVGLAAVASDPTSSTAHMDLGAAYFETGQYAQAEQEFRTAQELAKGSPIPLYNLAHVYRLTGRHEEAVAAFLKVTTLQSDALKWLATPSMFADARYWLGVEYLALGREADAIKALTPLTTSKPLDAEAAKALAKAYEATGDIDSAVKWLKAALQVQPQDAEAAAALKRLGK